MDLLGKLAPLASEYMGSHRAPSAEPDFEYQHPVDPHNDLPPGWIARRDPETDRWYYVDENTGRSQWQRPEFGPPGGYGPPGRGYGGGGGYGGGYGGREEFVEERRTYETDEYIEEKPKKNHNLAYGAGGAALGLAGGLLVGHEVHKAEEDWDYDKDRVEDDYDRAKYGVEDAPDRMAGWAGEGVGAIEGDYDRAKYDVEDAPDEMAGWAGRKVGDAEDDFERVKYDVEDPGDAIAGWAGRKVGDVEGDFDNLDNAYDAGRDEERWERDDY